MLKNLVSYLMLPVVMSRQKKYIYFFKVCPFINRILNVFGWSVTSVEAVLQFDS